MPMTLAEVLALLPDNTTGEISPADLRAVVTDLYQAAYTTGTAYPFKWATGSPPTAGHVTMDQPWQLTATKLVMSETADDGTVVGFGAVDIAAARRVWVDTGTAKVTADITGPSVDLGTYREVPIRPLTVTGTAPNNNAAVTVTLAVMMG